MNEDEEKTILGWIPNNYKSFNLIFDTRRDGDSVKSFIKKCKGQSPTLVIVETDNGVIFGGYATSAWKGDRYIEDNNSFCFSLNPNKKYNVTHPNYALYGYCESFNIMLQFGACYFRITSNCTENFDSCTDTGCYEPGLNDLIKDNFRVNRMEIFKLK